MKERRQQVKKVDPRDTVSEVPRELLRSSLSDVGYTGSPARFERELQRRGSLSFPEAGAVRARLEETVIGRLQQNVSALPETLQPKIGEVTSGISAFVYKNGWLGGVSDLASNAGLVPSAAETLATELKVTGLITVFDTTTRGGKSELWALSKEIDPILKE
jgi:hypothetical protein